MRMNLATGIVSLETGNVTSPEAVHVDRYIAHLMKWGANFMAQPDGQEDSYELETVIPRFKELEAKLSSATSTEGEADRASSITLNIAELPFVYNALFAGEIYIQTYEGYEKMSRDIDLGEDDERWRELFDGVHALADFCIARDEAPLL